MAKQPGLIFAEATSRSSRYPTGYFTFLEANNIRWSAFLNCVKIVEWRILRNAHKCEIFGQVCRNTECWGSKNMKWSVRLTMQPVSSFYPQNGGRYLMKERSFSYFLHDCKNSIKIWYDKIYISRLCNWQFRIRKSRRILSISQVAFDRFSGQENVKCSVEYLCQQKRRWAD